MEKEEQKVITSTENDYTEQHHGIIALRKGQLGEDKIWFGTVGNILVSDGAFGTKEELIKNLENVTLDRVCRIIAGAVGRMVELKKEKECK